MTFQLWAMNVIPPGFPQDFMLYNIWLGADVDGPPVSVNTFTGHSVLGAMIVYTLIVG